jgi:hypothetical protein
MAMIQFRHSREGALLSSVFLNRIFKNGLPLSWE